MTLFGMQEVLYIFSQFIVTSQCKIKAISLKHSAQ